MSPNEDLLLEHAAGLAWTLRVKGSSGEARAETRKLAASVAEGVARLLLAEARLDPRLEAVLAELYPPRIA
jgi:hypothetical protein